MHRGYIKLWRKVFESNVWKNKNLWRFWSWCLLKASHKGYKTMVGFQEIELQPGQFIFGRKSCAEETGLSEQNIRTCIRTLSATKLTIKVTNRFSIGTVINWESYQSENCLSNQQVTSYQPASNQQVTTNKNDKNVKNEKNIRKFEPPLEIDVINYFKEKGYRKDIAKKAFEYYNTANWKDSKGNQVRNWKQKMIAVWFKDENKKVDIPEQRIMTEAELRKELDRDE